MDNYSNVKKVCGFYVSNTHLVTMMLPYINKQMENDIKIISFFKYNSLFIIDSHLYVYYNTFYN